MDISEIRRQNMLSLIDRYEKQSEFAEAIGKPASYISQLKKGTKKNGKDINMGSEFAREIEKSLGLATGWLDNRHPIIHASQVNSGHFHNTSINQNVNSPKAIYQVDLPNIVNLQFYEQASLNKVSSYVISLNLVQQLNPKNTFDLFALPVVGKEMNPILPDKSIVIATKEKGNEPIYDGQIYALGMGDNIRCRYLEQLSGGRVRVYSEQNNEGEIFEQVEFEKHYQVMGGIVWQSNFFSW